VPTHLYRPAANDVAQWLARQRGDAFSYPEVGTTAGKFPVGYDHDRQRVLLGRGDEVFAAACEALRKWRQFPAGWTTIEPAAAPLAAGTEVVLLIHVLGLWWASGARIVYVVDEPGPPRRFGFAYGTLASHVERGEERFLIEMDQAGEVWYELAAFSRPRHWLLRVGYPLARRYQARFRRESAAAMQQFVQSAGTEQIECRS
jgi:uncharacterized protein (UPF0548 family)